MLCSLFGVLICCVIHLFHLCICCWHYILTVFVVTLTVCCWYWFFTLLDYWLMLCCLQLIPFMVMFSVSAFCSLFILCWSLEYSVVVVVMHCFPVDLGICDSHLLLLFIVVVCCWNCWCDHSFLLSAICSLLIWHCCLLLLLFICCILVVDRSPVLLHDAISDCSVVLFCWFVVADDFVRWYWWWYSVLLLLLTFTICPIDISICCYCFVLYCYSCYSPFCCYLFVVVVVVDLIVVVVVDAVMLFCCWVFLLLMLWLRYFWPSNLLLLHLLYSCWLCCLLCYYVMLLLCCLSLHLFTMVTVSWLLFCCIVCCCLFNYVVVSKNHRFRCYLRFVTIVYSSLQYCLIVVCYCCYSPFGCCCLFLLVVVAVVAFDMEFVHLNEHLRLRRIGFSKTNWPCVVVPLFVGWTVCLLLAFENGVMLLLFNIMPSMAVFVCWYLLLALTMRLRHSVGWIVVTVDYCWPFGVHWLQWWCLFWFDVVDVQCWFQCYFWWLRLVAVFVGYCCSFVDWDCVVVVVDVALLIVRYSHSVHLFTFPPLYCCFWNLLYVVTVLLHCWFVLLVDCCYIVPYSFVGHHYIPLLLLFDVCMHLIHCSAVDLLFCCLFCFLSVHCCFITLLLILLCYIVVLLMFLVVVDHYCLLFLPFLLCGAPFVVVTFVPTLLHSRYSYDTYTFIVVVHSLIRWDCSCCSCSHICSVVIHYKFHFICCHLLIPFHLLLLFFVLLTYVISYVVTHCICCWCITLRCCFTVHCCYGVELLLMVITLLLGVFCCCILLHCYPVLFWVLFICCYQFVLIIGVTVVRYDYCCSFGDVHLLYHSLFWSFVVLLLFHCYIVCWYVSSLLPLLIVVVICCCYYPFVSFTVVPIVVVLRCSIRLRLIELYTYVRCWISSHI